MNDHVLYPPGDEEMTLVVPPSGAGVGAASVWRGQGRDSPSSLAMGQVTTQTPCMW